MLQSIKKTEAPAYLYHNQLLTVEYSFAQDKPSYLEMNSNKLWLDILFMHPQQDEAVTIRIAKSTLILCQPKEVIEAVVHREIHNFLQQSHVKEYGTTTTPVSLMPAYS